MEQVVMSLKSPSRAELIEVRTTAYSKFDKCNEFYKNLVNLFVPDSQKDIIPDQLTLSKKPTRWVGQYVYDSLIYPGLKKDRILINQYAVSVFDLHTLYGVCIHELVHGIVGYEAGHNREFTDMLVAISWAVGIEPSHCVMLTERQADKLFPYICADSNTHYINITKGRRLIESPEHKTIKLAMGLKIND